MKTRMFLLWAALPLLLLAGCNSSAPALTKQEQNNFKGGGPIPPQARAEIAKHMAAMNKSGHSIP